MARLSARARPDRERVLRPARQLCPGCGGHMRLRYENRRTLVLLTGAVRLRLQIRRCEREGCSRYHVAYRPEAEVAIKRRGDVSDSILSRCSITISYICQL